MEWLELLWLPASVGLLVALLAGPLGSFVVWRRMAYFGDTLAHGALMGITLGILLDLNLQIAIIIFCLLLALLLISLQQQRFVATDTLLGFLAHSTLAGGLVLISFFDDIKLDLTTYLFGDLLAVSETDLIWIAAITLSALLALKWLWKPLVLITLNEDLASVEGVPVKKVRTLFMLMIAVVIASAMKVVGVLLITAMMIIPAAAARPLSKSPEQMAALASLIAMISVLMGMMMSVIWDTPLGPSVVVSASSVFICLQILQVMSKLGIRTG